jgi:Mn2+/Fe2+ NRAMP family transporter
LVATNDNQEKVMTTQISTKLAALAIALMVNSAMLGGVAFLFSGQLHPSASLTSLAHASPAHAATAVSVPSTTAVTEKG